jgi:hypothetical protein
MNLKRPSDYTSLNGTLQKCSELFFRDLTDSRQMIRPEDATLTVEQQQLRWFDLSTFVLNIIIYRYYSIFPWTQWEKTTGTLWRWPIRDECSHSWSTSIISVMTIIQYPFRYQRSVISCPLEIIVTLPHSCSLSINRWRRWRSDRSFTWPLGGCTATRRRCW